jgi:hypothetical protein
VRLIRNKKSLILISILLIVGFLIGGCGNKTSGSEAALPEEGQEISIQEDQKQTDSKEMEDSKPELSGSDPSAPVDDGAQSQPKASKTQSSGEEAKPKKDSSQKSEPAAKDIAGQKQEPSKAPEPVSSVTLSIIGPEDMGVIMKATMVEIEEGETVLDVLKKAARQNNIPISVRGKKSAAYVEGINNLFEFDHGAKSGWLYRVNGSIYSKSAGAFTLKDGDVIEWIYTLDLGRDIGADGSDLGRVPDE